MSDKWRTTLLSWHLLSPTTCWALGWAPRSLFKFNLLPPVKHDLLLSSHGWGWGRRLLSYSLQVGGCQINVGCWIHVWKETTTVTPLCWTNCIDLDDLPKEVVSWERIFQGLYKIDVLFKDYTKKIKRKCIFPSNRKRCSWETNDL